MAGITTDVTIISSRANLMKEISGLNAHRTLAPANPRRASKQMMWGGQVSLARRERFCAASTTEIAARTGQNSLCSGRATPCATCAPEDGKKKVNNGNAITANAHAASGTSPHLPLIGAEDRGLPNSPHAFRIGRLLHNRDYGKFAYHRRHRQAHVRRNAAASCRLMCRAGIGRRTRSTISIKSPMEYWIDDDSS